NDGQELTADDGGNWSGAIGRDQIDSRETQKSRSAGFANAQADYGPRDLGSIDARANRRSDKESRYSKERSRWDSGPSDRRSAAVLDEGGDRGAWSPGWFKKSWR